MMESPRDELEKLSAQLRLPLEPQKASDFESGFLDHRLRHTRFEARDLEILRAAPKAVTNLFQALQSAAKQNDNRRMALLDAALADGQRLLDDVAPILQQEWLLEQTVAQLRAQADSVAEHGRVEIEKLRHALAESERRSTEAVRTVEHLQAEIQRDMALLRSMEATIRSLEERAREQSAALDKTNGALVETLRSTSWRMTAPLRAIRRCVRPARHS